MTISREVLRIEESMQTILDTILAHHAQLLTPAWSNAWANVVGDLEAGLLALAEDGDVPGWKIMEHHRVAAGLEAAGEAMDMLTEQAGALFIDDATRGLGLGVDGEIAMIRQQLPEQASTTTRPDAQQLRTTMERTTQQITATTWPVSVETAEAIRQELLQGMIVGSNPREAARRMLDATEGRFTGGLARALNISRTEMLDAMRTGQQLTDHANRESLAGWEWSAHLDGRTCIACISMHGTRYPIEQPGPLDHQSGRCARVPVTKSWAELGFPEIPEPDLGTVDAETWFAGLTPEDQRAMLGPARFQAWAEGRYPMSAWAQRRTTPAWRDSIGPSPAPGGASAAATE